MPAGGLQLPVRMPAAAGRRTRRGATQPVAPASILAWLAHAVRATGVIAMSLTVAACALTYPARLPAGKATASDVQRVMGTPWHRFPEPDGGSIWVYPTGPLGREVWRVRLDGAGVVAGVEQMLNDRGFGRVVVGKSTKEDILRLFGPPFRTEYFERRHELAWDYRFRDDWQYPALFHVLFNDSGVVTGTMQVREVYHRGPMIQIQ